MTDGVPPTTFRVLGPLEVWAGERRLTIGSGRQRTLLAVLLMRAGDPVPVERLIDELWGEDPPPSAGHALEAYVSRLRGTLSDLEVTIERRGAGYRLDLGQAQVDSVVFEELLTQSREASARGDLAEAGSRAQAALALWRGAAYADVRFDGGPPSEAARLDELRLVAREQEIDAALAAGENAHAIGELRSLVEADPYREGSVSRLMVALYRSGRQAEALGVYETYRKRLSDDLGLEPPPSLQQLSGQIVRHERHLAAPQPSASQPPPPARPRRMLLIVGIAGLIAIAAGVAASLDSSAASKGPIRIGLLLPHKPKAGQEDTYVSAFVKGLEDAKQLSAIRTTTMNAPEFCPPQQQLCPTPQKLRQLDRTIRSNHLNLVLVAGSGASARQLIAQSNRFSHTRFVIVDFGRGSAKLAGHTNVTGLMFDDGQSGELAGYLAALMEPRTHRSAGRISVVGAYPIPQIQALIAGYKRGARLASPAIHVLVNYSDSLTSEAKCAGIANTQINHGSGVVFAAAGTCGLGALTAANIRGVWAIGADAEQPGFNNHLLTTTKARFDQAVKLAVSWYKQGSLPGGRVIPLGLKYGVVGITRTNTAVPPAISAKVATLAEHLLGPQVRNP